MVKHNLEEKYDHTCCGKHDCIKHNLMKIIRPKPKTVILCLGLVTRQHIHQYGRQCSANSLYHPRAPSSPTRRITNIAGVVTKTFTILFNWPELTICATEYET